MVYQIAEMLHMTPSDVLDGHTAAEMVGWRLYLEWKDAERERADLKSRTATAAKGNA